MQLIRAEQMVFQRGDKEQFTDTVWLNEWLNSLPSQSELRGPSGKIYLVFFEPEARTASHTHSEGQILYVHAGNGRAKSVDSSSKREQHYKIRPGDIISIALDGKHWHDAEPKSFMPHIAINPGKATCWMDKVTDEEYQRGFKS